MPNKVWMIIPIFHPVVGGGEIQIQRVSNRLANQHGLDVTVLTRRHGVSHQPLAADDAIDNVKIRRVWCPGRNWFGLLLYIFNGLLYLGLNGRRDVYEASDVKAGNWMAVIAGMLFGGHAIVRMRTGRYRYEKLFFSSRFATWWHLTPLRMADKVIVVNDEVRAYLIELGIDERKIARIPNGIDTNRFTPLCQQAKAKLRASLNLGDNKLVALYVGRMKAIKGTDVLLQAWAKLPPSIHDKLHLVMVGNDQNDTYSVMADKLGIGQNVSWLGLKSNVRDYYRAVDLFLLPSRTEGLSNSLLEAMSCELPSIASSVGGTPDFISNGETGFLFQSEAASDLAKQIDVALNRQSEWATIGKAARERVIAEADLDIVAKMRVNLYNTCLT